MLSNDLINVIELADRFVRTAEGSRVFGLPIGSPINPNSDAPGETKRPMTIERLRSLQAQFLAAKNTGNKAVMQDIQQEFILAVREFRKDHQGANVLRELTGSTGRQAQAAAK